MAGPVTVRRARLTDVPEIRHVFLANYGDDYRYVDFTSDSVLNRLVLADDTVMLVAEQRGRVVGTASVMLEYGAYSDLVGEFGRLAVHPEAQGQGIAGQLTAGRLREVEGFLQVGLIEARTAHALSQQNAERYGFRPVGFLPGKLRFAEREDAVLLTRYFGPALDLRRNNPRIIPEVYDLAEESLRGFELPCDLIVDASAAPYPPVEWSPRLEALSTTGYASLLRIERGRVANREIFGPLRLNYGFFRRRARHSHYLLMKKDGRILGAIGYVWDPVESGLRVFELISVSDRWIRPLLVGLLDRARHAESPAAYMEIDVSAHAPRMQRTLLELGFVPAAFVPALAFHDVERLDLVRMVRIEVTLDTHARLTDRAAGHARIVRRALRTRGIDPEFVSILRRTHLFEGLNAEQARAVAALGKRRISPRGTTLFRAEESALELFLVVDGRIDVQRGSDGRRIGTVGPAGVVGEMAMLGSGTHSATAVTASALEAVAINLEELDRLVRRRPDIGVLVYRNLGAELGAKLRDSVNGPEI